MNSGLSLIWIFYRLFMKLHSDYIVVLFVNFDILKHKSSTMLITRLTEFYTTKLTIK